MARLLRSYPAGSTHTRLGKPQVVNTPPVLGRNWQITTRLVSPSQQRALLKRRAPHSFFVYTPPQVPYDQQRIRMVLAEAVHQSNVRRRKLPHSRLRVVIGVVIPVANQLELKVISRAAAQASNQRRRRDISSLLPLVIGSPPAVVGGTVPERTKMGVGT